MTTRTRLADLMEQASQHLPLALSAALQAEHMAVCQEVDTLLERVTNLESALDSRDRALGFVPVEEITPPSP
jgi:hypothetical protein